MRGSNLSSHQEKNEARAGGRRGKIIGRQNSKSKKVKGKGQKEGFGEKRGAMMVVSVLIATLTYQAALNPPGGFWQDDQNGSAGTPAYPFKGLSDVHEAGTAINRNFIRFQAFMIANTVRLFASLVIILLLTSAITIKQQIMMWALMLIMWVSVFSVAFSFSMGALIILRPFTDPAVKYLVAFILGCGVLFVSLVILHVGVGLRKMYRWAKKKRSHGEEVGPSASLSLPRYS